jgi:VWFA-related protein
MNIVDVCFHSRSRILPALALFAMGFPAGVAVAQTPKSPTMTINVNSRLVVLDIVVTDKAGNVVNGLTQDDFTVLENNVPQTIHNFEPPVRHFIPQDLTIGSTADLEKKDPDAPINIIVLDEFNTRFTDMDFARYSIKKYIGAQPKKLAQPTELVAVNTTRFKVLHDYTQDGEALLTSLNKHLSIYPWNLVNNASGQGTLDRLAVSLGALEQVAEATKGHPGHKNIIWVGHGFPGIDTTTLEPDQTDSLTGAIQRALDMLRDARITLYTIDPTATSTMTVDITQPDTNQAEDITGQVPFTTNISFADIAPATGGKAYAGRNDIDHEIGTSVRDGSNFYSLSYVPTGDSDLAAPFRYISVRLKRPGLLATTRTGYFTQVPDGGVAMPRNQMIFDMVSAAKTTMNYDGLSVSAVPVDGHPDTYMLNIAQKDLTYKYAGEGSRSAELIVEAVSFGAKDKYLARTMDGVTVKSGNAVADGPEPARVKVMAKIVPGTVRLRFVVRDSASGRIGTADVHLP